uniref:hydantoinase/carbamoylase family amidase n=1 Tax=Paenirhodobacter enshiensis TaxID=1105367 RepID=UPI0035B27B9D
MKDVIAETIDAILSEVNAISLPGPGYTRPSYSPLESEAHRVIERRAGALGLTVSRDAGMNLFARLPGRDRTAPALFVGSHLDTVPMGGAYDGAAGVAGAMALAAAFVERGETPPVDLVVTVTRAEESTWFPVSYIGSRAALARLKPEEFEARRSDTGRTLAEHMRDEGGDPEAVLRGPGLPPAQFVEIHIEQGPILDTAGEPFALVKAIRGGVRYRDAHIHGVWAHSGGAPREGRADAVFAFADLVTAMDRIWGGELSSGRDLAVTFGRVDAASGEHAFAKVPGELGFCVDMRSTDDAELDRALSLFHEACDTVARARGVRFDLGALSRSRPAVLSEGLIGRIAEGAARLGMGPRRMVSGGGHDTAAFRQAGWEAMMVFIRNWDGSHNPREGMNPADLAEAVRALAASWGDPQGRA